MSGKLSAHRQRAEEEAAEDYAWSIRNADQIKPDWNSRNEILIEEFGLGGLVRIKRRAWQLLQAGKA